MKILIIPDVHTRHDIVESILEMHPDYDQVISLGDWFDNWNDTENQNRATAEFIKSKLDDPRWVFLYGNHDISYAFNNRYTVCAGYTDAKYWAIKDVLNPSDWDKFKFHHWVGDTLLTHAGLHKAFMSGVTGNLKDYLTAEETKAQMAMRQSKKHWFYAVGRCRGGNDAFGGLVWCDANMEFIPINELTQIFGHTCQYDTRRPLVIKDEESEALNICLDSALRHYGVIENNVFRIESTFKM